MMREVVTNANLAERAQPSDGPHEMPLADARRRTQVLVEVQPPPTLGCEFGNLTWRSDMDDASRADAKLGTPVLVTTEHRGVFFGHLVGEPSKEKVTLSRARNCIYWETKVGGFVGLATTGPTSGCRIGPAAQQMTLYDVTCVAVCSPQAVEQWEAATWT